MCTKLKFVFIASSYKSDLCYIRKKYNDFTSKFLVFYFLFIHGIYILCINSKVGWPKVSSNSALWTELNNKLNAFKSN